MSGSGTTKAAIKRQWLILLMLPQRPRRIDTGTIAARLREQHGIEVHRRTIQRDLIDLSEIFPIISDERSKPYGWRWADDAQPFSLVTKTPGSGIPAISGPGIISASPAKVNSTEPQSLGA